MVHGRVTGTAMHFSTAGGLFGNQPPGGDKRAWATAAFKLVQEPAGRAWNRRGMGSRNKYPRSPTVELSVDSAVISAPPFRASGGVCVKRLVSSLALGALLLGAGSAAAQSVQTYTYDSQGRLIGVATATGARGGGVVTEYDYDDAGNRTERQALGVGGPTSADRMTNGETLVPTQFLISPNAAATLLLQQDGNLVVYCGATPKWATATTAGRSMYFQAQSDGNLVIYDVDFLPIWASNTAGNPGAVLTLLNSGNLILKDSTGVTTLWQSATTCP